MGVMKALALEKEHMQRVATQRVVPSRFDYTCERCGSDEIEELILNGRKWHRCFLCHNIHRMTPPVVDDDLQLHTFDFTELLIQFGKEDGLII